MAKRKLTKKRQPKKQYKAGKGAQYNDADAQIIGARLEELGEVTPQGAVDDASKTASPLHPYFEWDDTAAASQHRLKQARDLINHLHVVIVTEGHEAETRAFHHVTVTREDRDENVYVAMDVVTRDADMSTQVIDKAKSELAAWRRRYAQYKSIFGGVFKAIDKMDEAA